MTMAIEGKIKAPFRRKLYTKDIEIKVKPYTTLFNKSKWKAESGKVEIPYEGWGGYEEFSAYGKTPEEAVERLKDTLCKITTREERQHEKHLAWKEGFKETTFNRDQDCNPVLPRPKLFS